MGRGVEVQKRGRRGKEREEKEDKEKEMGGGEEVAMEVTQEKSEVCISFPFSFQPETK